MATALTVQVADPSAAAGVTITLAAADATGNNFPNTGREVFVVNNGSGGSINVTVDSKTPCNQGADHDLVVAVGAGVQKMIGPFDPARYGSQVDITYSAVTSVTVAARKTP